MLYTMLIYHDEPQFKALPKEEQNRVHAACGVWHEALVKSGHSQGATGPQASALTKSLVPAADGSITVLDGPFTETKEMLGGFEVLACTDLAEAVAIAKRFPALSVGAKIELRPVVLAMSAAQTESSRAALPAPKISPLGLDSLLAGFI